MNKRKNKIIRVFMFVVGVIMILAGIILLIAEDHSIKKALIENFALFLTGSILIYLGLTWKKNQE